MTLPRPTETEAGPRIPLGVLFVSFTERERVRWFQWAGTCEMDEFGLLPAGVERFYAEGVRQRNLFEE